VETVIVLHGLWLARWTVEPLRRSLAARGFRSIAFGYASMNADLDTNAHALLDFVEKVGGGQVHFVGHSLGGLVTLRALAIAGRALTGRTVLLGAPSQGCKVVDAVMQRPGGSRIVGHSIAQWQRGQAVEAVGHHTIGAIAGSRALGIGSLFTRIPRPHDGCIRVEETYMPGLADHLVMDVSHSGMLTSRKVAHQTDIFLRTGRFERTVRR